MCVSQIKRAIWPCFPGLDQPLPSIHCQNQWASLSDPTYRLEPVGRRVTDRAVHPAPGRPTKVTVRGVSEPLHSPHVG